MNDRAPPRRSRTGEAAKVYPTAVVQDGARLGADAVVGAFCFVAAGAVIGAGTRLQSHVAVWKGVELGEDVFVGPAVTFTNVRHPRAAFSRADRFEPTRVLHGATLGANCVVVAPVTIGSCAVVAAGAVVTRDVAPFAVVAGNPARVIGWACVCGETVARGAKRPKRATCALCGRALPPPLPWRDPHPPTPSPARGEGEKKSRAKAPLSLHGRGAGGEGKRATKARAVATGKHPKGARARAR